MILEKQINCKNWDVTFSLFDSFGRFGDFALPFNISWSHIGDLFCFGITFLCLTFHVEIWKWNKGE